MGVENSGFKRKMGGFVEKVGFQGKGGFMGGLWGKSGFWWKKGGGFY